MVQHIRRNRIRQALQSATVDPYELAAMVRSHQKS